MPRIARMKMKGEPAVYHVMSRTALDGFPLGDVQKDFISKREKIPKAVTGLDGVFSLKRLSKIV